MTKLRLKFIHAYKDRHGKQRHRVRLPGQKETPLPGLPGSAEFMAIYSAAIAGKTVSGPERRPLAGSTMAVVSTYLDSRAFNVLAVETQRDRKRILNQFAGKFGDLPFALLGRKHVELAIAGKPHAARNLLKALRGVCASAIKAEIITADPTEGVRVETPKTAGFRMWAEREITQFEKHWPITSRERLAFALLLYTGQRRGDVIRLGRQHVHGKFLELRQNKTGADVAIPVHSALAAVLKVSKGSNLTFLTTETGAPFSPRYFTNWFGKAVRAAGLPLGLSAHGLRKAMCRRLAEAGCSASRIAAISGHLTLKEVERYVKGADQKRMALDAMDSIGELGSPVRQSDAQVVDSTEDEIADVSLVWTSTSRTSPSASTARQR